jgi:hypothetical protein
VKIAKKDWLRNFLAWIQYRSFAKIGSGQANEENSKNHGLFSAGLIYGPAEHDTCDMGMGGNLKVVDDQYMLYYFSVSMQVRAMLIPLDLLVVLRLRIREKMMDLLS